MAVGNPPTQYPRPTKRGAPVVGATSPVIPQYTTQPDEILFHRIKDEELTALAEANNSGYIDAVWAFGSFAGGLLIPTAKSLIDSYTGPIAERVPLSGLDLFQIVLLSGSFFLFVAALILWKRSSNKIDLLVTEIRNRRKIP
jgi:hypothetical protein